MSSWLSIKCVLWWPPQEMSLWSLGGWGCPVASRHGGHRAIRKFIKVKLQSWAASSLHKRCSLISTLSGADQRGWANGACHPMVMLTLGVGLGCRVTGEVLKDFLGHVPWFPVIKENVLESVDSQINGLVQERRNSSAWAMELHLSCTYPSKYAFKKVMFNDLVLGHQQE